MAGPWEQYQSSASAPVAAEQSGPWAAYQPKEPQIEPPNTMARVGRGMMDVAQGLKQLWLMGTDPEAAKKYTKEVNEEIALYEQGRGKGAGTDWARIGGNVAASAPAMLVPGGQAAGLGARVASGAVGGALANGAMFSEEGTFGDKAAQASVGAVTGGAVPAALSGIVKAGSGVANKIYDKGVQAAGSATGAFSPTQINITLQQTLAGRGIDFAKLSAEARGALASDVRETLKAGGTLNADDLERKAALLAVGAKPTQGMVSRDPKRWAFERNTADINGPGDRLKVRFMENNQAFNDFAGRVQKSAGGRAADQFSASDNVLSSLRAGDAAKKSAVDAAYESARGTNGRYVDLDHTSFVNQANDALDQGMLGTYLPDQVRGLLNKVALGELPLNVNTAVQLDSVLSAAQRAGNPAEQKAIGVVRSALADAPAMNIEGEATRAAFDKARGLARDRFSEIEKIPGLKAALDGAEPDQFFGKYVLRGNASDVKAMGDYLQKSNPGAWDDVRSQTVQWLIDKATSGRGAEGTFSGTAFRKALDSLGLQRQQALFSAEEIAQLHTLQKAASAGTEAPAFAKSSIGSNTAEKVTNLLNKAGNIPYLRELVVNPIKNTVQDAQVSRTLGGMAQSAGRSVPPLVSKEAQDAISKRFGAATVPLSVLINGAATR